MKLIYTIVCLLAMYAGNITYANTIIYVTQNGTGSKDGSSWSNAMDAPQLKPALDAALSGTDFWVAAGIYYPGDIGADRLTSFNLKSGIGIYGGFAGGETAIAERNIAQNVTTLTGDLDRSGTQSNADAYHVIFAPGVNGSVIDGFTITFGKADLINTEHAGGGGIFFPGSSGTTTINNCIFINNYAFYGGGAVFISSGNVLFTNSRFLNNTAANYGATSFCFGSETFTNCIISGTTNNSLWIAGGSGQTLNLINCTISGNTTYFYGIISVAYANMHMTNTIVWNNAAYYSNIIDLTNAVVTVDNSNIEGGWSGDGTNNINLDPKFSNNNFELMACSPAINTGTNTGAPLTDLNGHTRPYAGTNAVADMGAYEYQDEYSTITPSVTIDGPAQICTGQTATYSATPVNGGAAPTYQWQINGVNAGTNNDTLTIDTLTANALITCTLTSSETCAVPASVTSNNVNTTVYQIPDVQINGSNGICGTDPVALSANAVYNSYAWSTNETTESISITAAGTYSLTAFLHGCSASDTVTIIQKKAVINPHGVPATICANQSAQLQGGFVSGPSYTQTKVYSPGLVNFNGTCSGSNVRLSRAIYPGNDPGFSWNDEGSGKIVSVKVEFNVGIEENSHVRQTIFNGTADPAGNFQTQYNSNCFNSATPSNNVVLFMNPSLYLVASQNLITIPNGTFSNWGLTLSQGGGSYVKITVTYETFTGSYAWSNGDTTENTTVSPTETTTYTLTATNDGCTATGTATVNVTARPVISVNGPVTNLCQTDSVVLTSTTADTYAWSTGDTTQSITVHSAGTYTLDANSCATTTPVDVSYRPMPYITVNGPDHICPGYTVGLSVTSGDSYLWSTGSTTDTINVSETGNYTATVTTDGCVQTVSQQITVEPLAKPIVNLFNGTSICGTGYNIVDMFLDNYDYYLTYTGSSDSLVNYYGTFLTAFPGTYSITGKDQLGCSATSDSFTIVEAPGNPDLFGDNIWNVSLFDNGIYWGADEPWKHYVDDLYNGFGKLNAYHGYYVDSDLSFDTRTKWDENGSPYNAAGFNGCDLIYGPDNFSWTAKRKGFPCGNYRISIPAHDDDAQLWINGVMEWEHVGCCDNHENVWQGVLGPNTTIEFRSRDYGGGANGAVTITLQDTNVVAKPTITPGGPISICSAGSAILTSSAAINNVWSTAETTQSITIHVAGNYRVAVTGAEGCTATSDAVSVSAMQAQTYYADADHDSYGDADVSILDCSQPEDYVTNHADCDDANPAVNPGAGEICGNGIDDNCNGQIDEGCTGNVQVGVLNKARAEGRNQSNMKFTIRLSKKTAQTVQVNYTTQNISAIAGSDYVATSGTATFAPGVKKQTINVTILGNRIAEPDETFRIILSSPVNATIAPAYSQAVGTILNDDGNSTASAITQTSSKTARPLPGKTVKVSPNPATDVLYVQLTGYTGNVTLLLHTIDGRILKQEKMQAMNANFAQQLEVSGLASGVYVLKVIDQKGNVATEKVIVTK